MHVKGTRRRRRRRTAWPGKIILHRERERENERGRLIEAALREAELREVGKREKVLARGDFERESGRADASERTQVSSHCTLAAKSCRPAATATITTIVTYTQIDCEFYLIYYFSHRKRATEREEKKGNRTKRVQSASEK